MLKLKSNLVDLSNKMKEPQTHLIYSSSQKNLHGVYVRINEINPEKKDEEIEPCRVLQEHWFQIYREVMREVVGNKRGRSR